ncbi:MAG: hypothetical protein ACF8R7_16645 [Phycisphaerales bacterium JB039]
MREAQEGSTIVTLRLVADPPGPDADGREPLVRLRLMLMMHLRRYGWRTLDLRQEPPAPQPERAP